MNRTFSMPRPLLSWRWASSPTSFGQSDSLLRASAAARRWAETTTWSTALKMRPLPSSNMPHDLPALRGLPEEVVLLNKDCENRQVKVVWNLDGEKCMAAVARCFSGINIFLQFAVGSDELDQGFRQQPAADPGGYPRD